MPLGSAVPEPVTYLHVSDAADSEDQHQEFAQNAIRGWRFLRFLRQRFSHVVGYFRTSERSHGSTINSLPENCFAFSGANVRENDQADSQLACSKTHLPSAKKVLQVRARCQLLRAL